MTKEEKAKKYFEEGLKAQENGEYDKARQLYEKSIERDPNYTRCYYWLAKLLTNNYGEHEKARELYENAIEFSETPYDLAQLLITHFYEYDEAKKYYEKEIEITPKFAKPYYYLAYLLDEHLNEPDKARQYYKKALSFDNHFLIKKIDTVILKKYNQFEKNTRIDLTYPEGHKKAGQPLDRVCFIGQSGTGKTSLLELIKAYISNDHSKTPNANFQNVHFRYTFYDKLETDLTLINFPPYAVENIKLLDSQDALEYRFEELSRIVDFGISDPKKHWYPVLKEITEFQSKAIKYSSQLGYDSAKVKDVERFQRALKNYEEKMNELKQSNNSLEEFEKFISPLLSKFHLRVKTEPIDPDEIKFIPIEKINKNADNDEVKNEFLSTGTLQILSRAVPLYSLKPEHAIILIDEPENSLYPDVQKQLIDFLTKESWNRIKTCQFFFATHSPTIASLFEPWEIVELKFNENGKVVQELYYEGKRHVDNFKIHPQYLRWDKILTEVFDLDKEGDEKRQSELYELSKIQSKLEYYKQSGEEEKRNAELEKFKEKAAKLSWDINNVMP